MGQKSYLTLRLKNELLLFLAGVGENYDKYIEWCDRHQIPQDQRFTKKYLHTWVQRRRPKFQNARADHNEEIRRLSMYDREKRIADLENDLGILNSHIMVAGKEHSAHQCTKCGFTHEVAGPEVVIKLIEQKRKISQAISVERGEWNKGESEEKKPDSTRDMLRAAAMEALVNANRKVTIIDAPRPVEGSEGGFHG